MYLEYVLVDIVGVDCIYLMTWHRTVYTPYSLLAVCLPWLSVDTQSLKLDSNIMSEEDSEEDPFNSTTFEVGSYKFFFMHN